MSVNQKNKHSVNEYITQGLTKLNWKAKDLSFKSGISHSDLTKLKNGTTKKIKAETFYRLYTAFGDNCSVAAKTVYPNLKLKLHPYKERKRTPFGQYMQSFEVIDNSLEKISAKTGIEDSRLKELYYRTGSIEASELLLIEAAIQKEPGTLFEGMYAGKIGELEGA